MLTFSSILLIMCLQVIPSFSRQYRSGPKYIPPHCRRLPAGVPDNFLSCCKIPPLFSDQDFEKCNFIASNEEEEEPHPRQARFDCTLPNCLLKQYGLISDDEPDRHLIAAFLDDFSSKNETFHETVEIAKKRCVTSKLSHLQTTNCVAHNILMCIAETFFTECNIWEQNNGCGKLKDHMDVCKTYYSLDY